MKYAIAAILIGVGANPIYCGHRRAGSLTGAAEKTGKGIADVFDGRIRHPIAWYHTFEGGRSFVTALGHMPELYRDKTFLDHLYGGIYWAATGRGIDQGK
jgi:hypothetical protein